MFFHNSYIICSLCGMNPLFFRIQRNHNLLKFWKCFGVSQQRRCQKFEILKVTKIELEYSDQESHWIIHKNFDIYANFMKLSLCSSTPIKISHRTLSSLFSSEWFSKVPAFFCDQFHSHFWTWESLFMTCTFNCSMLAWPLDSCFFYSHGAGDFCLLELIFIVF